MRDELDGLLDRYAPEAGELWLSALPDPAPEHEFSPEFRRKVEKLLLRQRRSPAVNAALRYGRRAAAFALVFLTLSFSCLMTVNAAFRERVIHAVVQVFQDFTEFVYTSDSSAVGKPGNLVFTYLPEGMEEQDREQDEVEFYVYYESPDGAFVELSQILVEDGTEVLLGLDTEDAEFIDLTVHGTEAVGIVKGLSHTIHWTEGQFVYTLSGTIPMEELEKVAEGIK